MENNGKMTIVLNLPLADTPDLREKVIGSLNEFVSETIAKITLDGISLQ
jgi:hypothetical protein